jgi:uncharacterized protein
MNPLFEPLTDAELDRLDRFLLERIDEDADTDGRDEGVLNISELDGLFTALVSGPEPVMPSRWLPAIWGDFQPLWENEQAFEAVVTLLMRHMNGIATHLLEEPETFEPLFLEREVKGKVYTIVDDWCEGYLRGVALTAERWETGGLEMSVLLAPIRAFSSETHWRAHDMASAAETDNIRNAITPNVRGIHAYWLARRDARPPVAAPVRRTAPRVGRNDPCPCGSGKKYKRCCLH